MSSLEWKFLGYDEDDAWSFRAFKWYEYSNMAADRAAPSSEENWKLKGFLIANFLSRTLTGLRHVHSLRVRCSWWTTPGIGANRTWRTLTRSRWGSVGLYCQRNSLKLGLLVTLPLIRSVIFLPVSLANIIGGPLWASAKCRVRGYFVLLNKCRTMQMRPARTAIPVVTPKRVGRSAAIKSMWAEEI